MTDQYPPVVPTPITHKVERYQDADGKWRVRLIAQRHKFDEERKTTFLTALAEHGIKGKAAAAAGITTGTVNNHLKSDSDFAEAYLAAQEEYQSKVLLHHQNLIFNGVEKRTFDRNGNIVSEEVQYPIRLIELELKKVDEGYRDKREVSVDVTGGVLVAPAAVASIDDWEKKFVKSGENDGDSTPGQIIEGEVVE